MNLAGKTKKDLIDELEALRLRISELEKHERDYRKSLESFGQSANQSFPPLSSRQEGLVVVFDRKLEFVNDTFAELFGVSPEEACCPNFDPMTLIAPESRHFIWEIYQEGCRSAYKKKQINFIGLSKEGSKLECETFLLFIPYKWGVAIQCTLNRVSVSGRIDEALKRHYSGLPITVNAVPTGVLYADRDRLLMQANETIDKSNGLPVDQIPSVDYPVNQASGNYRHPEIEGITV
jgi:PAS domain